MEESNKSVRSVYSVASRKDYRPFAVLCAVLLAFTAYCVYLMVIEPVVSPDGRPAHAPTASSSAPKAER